MRGRSSFAPWLIEGFEALGPVAKKGAQWHKRGQARMARDYAFYRRLWGNVRGSAVGTHRGAAFRRGVRLEYPTADGSSNRPYHA